MDFNSNGYLKRIHQDALRVLEEGGIRCNSKEVREIFENTGIQFMELNTSTQLFSLIYNKSPYLAKTATLLMVPDYLNYLLSGKRNSEYSIATTTQLFNPNVLN